MAAHAAADPVHPPQARNRRIAAAAAACGGICHVAHPSRSKPTDNPVVRIVPATPVFETIAVMRIDDHGTIRLEEVAAHELGTVELALGQTPLLSDDMLYW